MSSRLTSKTREEIETFRDILLTVGGLLELDFIQKAFEHMKDNPDEYDHKWLLNALLVGDEFSRFLELNVDDQCLVAATVMLLESGRQYHGLHPYEDSAAFATVFLHKHARHFFDLDDIELISRCCKQVKLERMRVSVTTKVELVVRNTLLMTDVLFSNVAKVVIEFVRENVAPSVAPQSTEEWSLMLADRFAERYGNKGYAWRGLPNFIATNKAMSLENFKATAENKVLISEIIGNSYARIFSKR